MACQITGQAEAKVIGFLSSHSGRKCLSKYGVGKKSAHRGDLPHFD